MQPFPFSVSKVNQVLSLVIIFVFFLLALFTFLTALRCYIGWWPSVLASKCAAMLAMLVTGMGTGIVVLVLYYKGKTKQAKENFKRFDIKKYQTAFPTKTEAEDVIEIKSTI